MEETNVRVVRILNRAMQLATETGISIEQMAREVQIVAAIAYGLIRAEYPSLGAIDLAELPEGHESLKASREALWELSETPEFSRVVERLRENRSRLETEAN